MENSGVLAQQLIKEGGQTTLQAAQMAKKIAKMNEESKLNASRMASDVSSGIEGVRYQNSLARYENRKDTYGSLFDAVSTGVGGYIQGVDKASYSKLANDPDFLRWLLNRDS